MSGIGSGSRNTGYQGFKSTSMQECPTLKPGESYESRNTKFSKMGSHIIHSASSNRLGNASFESVTALSMTNVKSGDYHVPDKRGVMSSEPIPLSKPFIASSTYQQDYLQYATEARHILEHRIEEYQHAFESLSDPEENSIDSSKIAIILQKVLADKCNKRIVEIYESHFDHSHTEERNRISWIHFQAAVSKVNDFLLQETKTKSGKAMISWLEGHTSPQKKVIPATTPSSSHQKDYGVYGDVPSDRPYMRKRGMASTTSDLNDGTTRDTHHLPGYTGFLPRTTHNPEAVAQSNGAKPRSTDANLRLYHNSNVPGYTGHKPADCANARGEVTSGCDPRTTNGAVFKPHQFH